MMNRLIKFSAFLSILCWAGLVQAGLMCASTNTTSALTGVSGCELGTTNNDTLNPLQVNYDSMFGFTDWVFDAKDDGLDGVNEGSDSLNLSLIGGTQSGTWSIDSNNFSDVMMVFKGGAGNNTSPSNYVGYLLSSISGSYQSPFINTNNNNFKDISHVSLYVRGTNNVPEPSVIALMGVGLIGLGFARRRVRTQ